ncbi:FecCD family ABC transporter permease [Dehalococcoides mccartyi]|uniref:FecCD family ABC transporter permease n=1 Tax=Dehalococcoides mccartyi TaxID=61435 RepID=UPI00071DC0B3|nr:iron ABC transporter permease [Dehalococcoides mccartyi]
MIAADITPNIHSFLTRRWLRYLTVFLALGAAALLLLILNVALGSVNIPLGETVKIILNGVDSNEILGPIVWNLRLPRALATLICGGGLAVSGLVLQVFFRNPIVDPYVLGISSGATFVVALVTLGTFLFGASTVSTWTVTAGAFIGAMAVMLVVMAVASKVKNIITLLVIGLMVGYLTGAFSSILTTFAESESIHRFVIWSMGSFSGFRWDELTVVAIFGLVFIGAAFLMSKTLNAFLLGENYARSVGVNLGFFRYRVIIISSALAAAVTAFAGPVAFIGLAAPHIIRVLFGTSDNRILIPACVLGGAALTALCDLLARMLFAPLELPISATTALFGAPVVIFLLLKRKTSI